MPRLKKYILTAAILLAPALANAQSENSSILSNSAAALRLVGTAAVPARDCFVAMIEDRSTRIQEAVEPGDTFENKFKVVAIGPKSVDLLDLKSSTILTIKISGRAELSTSSVAAGRTIQSAHAAPPAYFPTSKTELEQIKSPIAGAVDTTMHSEPEEIIASVRQQNGQSLYGTAKQFAIKGKDGIDGLAIYSLTPESLFARAGIKDGDIIRMINSRPIKKVGDYYQALSKQTSIEIFFEREGQVQRTRINQG